MLLAIDVGNTNTAIALFEQQNLLKQWRLSTVSERTADQYALSFTQLCALAQIDHSKIDSVIISSVVPETLFSLKKFCTDYINCAPKIVGTDDIKLNFDILIDKPEELGSDRIVNTIAAYEKYGGNNIVIDFGTATTFDISDENGNYIGGAIAPGIELSIDSLHKAAALLPSISLAKPPNVLAKNTVHAMQSGIYWGYVSLVEGIVERLEAELEKKLTTVVTGGLASVLFDASKRFEYLDVDLNIRGLKLLHDLNSKI